MNTVSLPRVITKFVIEVDRSDGKFGKPEKDSHWEMKLFEFHESITMKDGGNNVLGEYNKNTKEITIAEAYQFDEKRLVNLFQRQIDPDTNSLI